MSDPGEGRSETPGLMDVESDLPILGPFLPQSRSEDDIDSQGNPAAEEFEYVNPDYHAGIQSDEANTSASGLIQNLLDEQDSSLPYTTDESDAETDKPSGSGKAEVEPSGSTARSVTADRDRPEVTNNDPPGPGSSDMKSFLRTDYDWGMARQTGKINIHVQSSTDEDEDDGGPLTSAKLRRPKRDTRVYDKHGLVGLRNIGNTCFMNSVLQCLSNTKLLLNYIVATKAYLEEINTTTSSMRGSLIKAFAKLMQDLWSDSKPHDADTSNLKGQIQRFAPVFRGARQHDSQELLRYLLEGLHNDVNRVTYKPKLPALELDDGLEDAKKSELSWSHYQKYDNSQVTDIFVGQLKSTLKCLACGHRSVTFDPFWDLSIPIPFLKAFQQAIKLEECLKLFTQEETLDGCEKPYCSACKTHRKCTKRITIEKFPDVLVIHLKRFTTDDRGKLRTSVKFPMLGLDMGAFMDTPIPSCMYNLYGISNHYGTAFSGHYIGYCKHPFSNYWHCYDDSRVSKVSEDDVNNVEGYVLFYEMCDASRSILKASSA